MEKLTEVQSRPADLVTALENIVGADGLLSGAAVRQRSAGIWGPPRTLAAELLVRPVSTAELAAVLALCHERRQPVVTHGGLTGVVDGAWAESGDLVVSLERLNEVEQVDPVSGVMHVQAGATLAAVQEAASRHGMLFPLDIGARGSATIGGNIATNAGGNRVIRYGMTRQLVLGLEAVLADGTVISQLNQMLKNNAGYDLKQLFIGSEGTLGIVTRAVLRLLPQPVTRETALLAVNGYDRLTRLLNHLQGAFGGALSAFEVMWRDYYTLMNTTGAAPLDDTWDYYVLVELLGSDAAADAERFVTVLDDASQQTLVDEIVIAKSGSEQDRLWSIRDDVVRLLDIEPMFLFDVSLPIGAVETYLDEVRAGLSASWPDPRMFVFGHLGDGNIHLAISAGEPDGQARSAVETCVYRPLGPLHGSVSAEHGIGREKKAYLSWSRSEAEIQLMKRLKATLDPHGILNPRIIFE